ncbi:MAG: transporter substrate-binding domain-containing protein [Clostridia bacterium]|nr:transporter substrate-binding domain-containing protein [Clostridia bacterium]
MKKFIMFLMTAILAVMACVGFTACGGGEDKQYVDTKTKNITVGITNAAPMNYKNSDGKWVGFDTDLTITVFNALGYNVLFKEIEWSNKYIELESGTIDCIWNGFTANSSDKNSNGEVVARSELVNFSINYMINEQCVVRNKNVAFTDENSFAGKTIAFETGSSGAAGVGYIEEDYPEIVFNKKAMVSQSKALQEVNGGTADFAVVDKSIAENAVLGYSNIEIVEFDYFELEYYAIGFKKNAEGAALRDKVNVLLDAFYEIGYLEELCTKYNIEYTRVQQAFVGVE